MFRTSYIFIDGHGINLMKNHTVETHIDYLDIRQITITKGFIFNRWVWVLAVGVLAFIDSLFWGISNIRAFNFEWGDLGRRFRVYFMFQMTPWMLALGSIFLIYKSLRKSKVLIIETYSKRYRVSILDIETEHQVDKLVGFLRSRVKFVCD